MATRANTRKYNWGKVVNEGAGGFLSPPTHPEHTQSVRSTFGDTFFMSLSSARDSEWLNQETRIKAKWILKKWNPLPVDHEDVQDWIHHVLGYFKNCYKGKRECDDLTCEKCTNEAWNADKLRIRRKVDPMRAGMYNLHAGVHLIRKYYPDFKPTENDFANAYRGTKA